MGALLSMPDEEPAPSQHWGKTDMGLSDASGALRRHGNFRKLGNSQILLPRCLCYLTAQMNCTTKGHVYAIWLEDVILSHPNINCFSCS